VSDHEADAGTQKQKQEKAGPQDKQKVVSIKRAITQAQARKETTVQLPGNSRTALSSVVRSFFLDPLYRCASAVSY
jgi:hypothetical protein